MEPESNLKVLIPRTVHQEGKASSISVVNASDNFVTIKKGRAIMVGQKISMVTLDKTVTLTLNSNPGSSGDSLDIVKSCSANGQCQRSQQVTPDTLNVVTPEKIERGNTG